MVFHFFQVKIKFYWEITPVLLFFSVRHQRSQLRVFLEKVGGVVVCRHGETQRDSAALLSNVMTADSTVTEPGPPCYFSAVNMFSWPSRQNKAVPLGNNESENGAKALGVVAAQKLCHEGKATPPPHHQEKKRLDILSDRNVFFRWTFRHFTGRITLLIFASYKAVEELLKRVWDEGWVDRHINL